MNGIFTTILLRSEIPQTVSLTTAFLIGFALFLGLLCLTSLIYFQIPKAIESFLEKLNSLELKDIFEPVLQPDPKRLSWLILFPKESEPKEKESFPEKPASPKLKKVFEQVFQPYQKKLSLLILFMAIDLIILAIAPPHWLKILEFPLSLFIAVNICLLGFKIFNHLFEGYFLEVALEDRRNIDSELLALAQFAVKSVFILVIIFLFAQIHQINLIGLIASLGIAGAAIAFASQKILEQILWSIVLYLDRPFSVGDYIHLSGGIIGQVETTGWRSTKVRLSGKNTLVIVPNSSLAQNNIENLTKARRAILIVDLIFLETMSNEEKALIRQLILDSTREILGIDSQLTQIMFYDEEDDSEYKKKVRTQAIFFVLDSAENSMKFRKDLLQVARNNIIKKLQNSNINFKEINEKIVGITQPMQI